MPQIDSYPYTQTVTTVPEFARALDSAVATDCDPAITGAFLEENSWENRARQLLDWSDELSSDGFKRLIAFNR